MLSRRSLGPILLLAAALAPAVGCRAARAVREPEYFQLARSMSRAWADPDPVSAAINPIIPTLAGPHPVEEYIAFGLSQNPEIQAARMRVEMQANRVPQAASLSDPTLNVMTFPFFPNVPQTASGRMRADMTISQKVPWVGKLSRRVEAAEEETEMARADLAAQELEIIENIRRVYYELYFVQQSMRITEEDRGRLRAIAEIVDIQYRVGRNVNQQDLLRVEVELSRVEAELVRLGQQLESAQARLARQLHISPETPVRALDRLPPEQIPHDLELLYRQAIAVRPELQSQLAAIQRDRTQVELARLNYVPDVTVSFGWGEMTTSGAIAPSADGIDNLSLGFMMNLPVYRKRLDAGVREAEAQVVATARRYDALKDQTLQQVKDLYAQAVSQEQLLRLFRDDIVPRSRLALEQSIRAYPVGEVDFLQMLDNWRELLRYEIMEQQLESQLRQTLASLARVIGGYEIRPRPEELPPVRAGEPFPPEFP